jgi:hypothetical protein
MMMKTIRVRGQVDEHHRLHADVPATVAPGPVEVDVVIPSESRSEDDAGTAWEAGVAREWAQELTDPRQDIYTINDGEPIDGSR